MILVNILAVIGGVAIYTLIWLAVIKILLKHGESLCGLEMIIFYIFAPVTIIFFTFWILVQIVIGITYPFWKTYELSEKVKKLEKKSKSRRKKK